MYMTWCLYLLKILASYRKKKWLESFVEKVSSHPFTWPLRKISFLNFVWWLSFGPISLHQFLGIFLFDVFVCYFFYLFIFFYIFSLYPLSFCLFQTIDHSIEYILNMESKKIKKTQKNNRRTAHIKMIGR